MRNRTPPFQGMGASLSPFPPVSFSAGVRGPRGDFRIPGLLGAPRDTASNSPKELVSIRSQGPSEGLNVPAFILARSLPVLDSVGNGGGHRQGPSLLCEVAQENIANSQYKSRASSAPIVGDSCLYSQDLKGESHPSEPQRNACGILDSKDREPWPVWLRWLGVIMQNKRLPVQFLVRAHAWVAGSAPDWGTYATNLYFSPSLSLSLPISKKRKKEKKEG